MQVPKHLDRQLVMVSLQDLKELERTMKVAVHYNNWQPNVHRKPVVLLQVPVRQNQVNFHLDSCMYSYCHLVVYSPNVLYFLQSTHELPAGDLPPLVPVLQARQGCS